MELNRPFAAITPTLDGDALLVLARTDRPMTAPAIAVAARSGSEAGMRNALRRLSAQGLVIRERTGHHDSYALNRRHLLADAIEMIAQASVELRARLVEEVSGWGLTPTFVALFGSAAYGAMRPDSDVDLLVVRPDTVETDNPAWADQLIGLCESGRAWTGNDVRVLELGETEMRTAVATGEQVIDDIVARGYPLTGQLPARSVVASG